MARYKIDCCKKDCPERSGECHGTCERYKTQRAEYEVTMEEEKKKGDIRRGLVNQKCHNIERIYKRCHLKGR